MKPNPLTGLHTRAALGALAAAAVLVASTAASAASPFAGLDGRWSGGGHASFEGGQRESLRCNATYRTGGAGSSLVMNLRCASASATIHLQGNLRASGSRVSGSWSESTYGVGGDASGSGGGEVSTGVVTCGRAGSPAAGSASSPGAGGSASGRTLWCRALGAGGRWRRSDGTCRPIGTRTGVAERRGGGI